MQALKLLGQQLTKIWSQIGVNQKVVIVISGLAVLACLVGIVVWSSRPSYSLLYGRLDPMEAGKIVGALEEMGIRSRLGAGGSAIYVPDDQRHRARAQLAVKGMPKTEGVGFEIFEKPTFGMSDFVQQVNYLRAVQGELARTIREFEGVEDARVMIVKPENRLLIDPQKKTTASVFLKLRGNTQLQQNTVNSIRSIVANAVEGLKANNVAVADNFGNQLSDNEEEGSIAALSGSQLAMRRNVERYLADKVKMMLEPVLGQGHVVVQVSAEVNNETMTKVDEIYNPGNSEPVPRMQVNRGESTASSTPQPGGVVGATVNASTGTNAPYATTSNQTTNVLTQVDYAVSRSQTNITRFAGSITKITASVFVNTNSNPIFTNSTVTNVTRLLADLQASVQNALGLEVAEAGEGSAAVKLVPVAFNDSKVKELDVQFETQQRTEFIWRIGKSVLYALLGLAALFGFWKLVKSSSEELLPTGIPVGQLVGGQLVYEAPVGLPGMAVPTGAIQTLTGEQKVEEIAAADQDVEELQAAKSKLVMDFGLGQQAPERITIEVLKQLIRENPAKMSQAARIWMSRKTREDEAV